MRPCSSRPSTLRRLAAYDDGRLAGTDPDEVAGEVAAVFAQFDRLVTSTRQFCASLAAVLNRYDLSREDIQAFKAALLDHLQRFVEEIARALPQIAEHTRASGRWTGRRGHPLTAQMI